MYYSHTQARAKLPKKRRRVVNTSAISEARKNRRNRSESKKMSLTKLGIVSRHGESVSALSSSIYANKALSNNYAVGNVMRQLNKY